MVLQGRSAKKIAWLVEIKNEENIPSSVFIVSSSLSSFISHIITDSRRVGSIPALGNLHPPPLQLSLSRGAQARCTGRAQPAAYLAGARQSAVDARTTGDATRLSVSLSFCYLFLVATNYQQALSRRASC
jgi:hypothetical protein